MAEAAQQPTPDNPRGSRIPLGVRKARLNPLHGRIVQTLKLVLPTTAIALSAAVIVWPMIIKEESRFAITITEADRKSAKNLQVFNATYAGFMGGNSRFTITSDEAEKLKPDDPTTQLTNPKGDVLAEDGAWYAVTAKSGRLNEDTQTLELFGGVNAFQDTGLEFRTDNVVIDFASKSGYGLDPIQGQGPFGYVEAEGFRIYNMGERVELVGKSKLVIYSRQNGS